MNNYKEFYSDAFKKDVKKIASKPDLQIRLNNKINDILENPYHYKPLRNNLKNKRRTHIGSFVLVFEIIADEKMIIFHAFKHHDEVYKND